MKIERSRDFTILKRETIVFGEDYDMMHIQFMYLLETETNLDRPLRYGLHFIDAERIIDDVFTEALIRRHATNREQVLFKIGSEDPVNWPEYYWDVLRKEFAKDIKQDLLEKKGIVPKKRDHERNLFKKIRLEDHSPFLQLLFYHQYSAQEDYGGDRMLYITGDEDLLPGMAQLEALIEELNEKSPEILNHWIEIDLDNVGTEDIVITVYTSFIYLFDFLLPL